MRIGLFIPCYVQAVYPAVAEASLRLLQNLGLDVEVPARQTCCGQPMGNAGFEEEAGKLAAHFEDIFASYDYVVGPSASCVSFVKERYDNILAKESHRCPTDGRIYEICEFIHDIVKPASINASFHHKVTIQNSCHGVRLLHLSSPSERNIPYYNKLRDLLSMVKGIEILEPERRDECCGFGGMFSVEETDVSGKMGLDKVRRHIATGAEYIVGADCSCLMHQDGIIARQGFDIKTMHLVQVLTAAE